ncbi:hypothetical protein ACFO1B_19400 [Dactylosporangium siamense]|uniref:Lipoprotein n=1 Tax=Dactylosporangium siamense TaxID=685454 RepID=A0A919U9S8_9ACTN|nr:hypothetical protein [Dactylosporangium siamense]GIG44050.1 hypothetical protein Dsi01nite_020910 [Dactylosporangium siamense]
MKHITVLFTLALAAAGLSACDAEVTSASGAQARPIASSPAALPPNEALLAAVQALDTTAYNFNIKQGTKTGGGRIDPAAKSATMELGGTVEQFTVSVAYTVIAPQLWVKADFGKELNQLWGLPANVWMLVDLAKVGSTATLPVDKAGAPKLGVTELFKNGLVEVKRTDATHFTGTVDVTAADTILAPTDDVLKKAGAKAKAVPFTATVDGQGRLTAFAIDGASIDPELAMQLTFAGFGSVLPVTEPAGATPAPDSVYQLFS